jgi:glucose-6-phosphate 1-dehydrogenase
MGTRSAEVKHHNHVSIRIGRDAGASVGVLVKDATSDSAEPIHLDVSFREHVKESPEPYERLLGDALVGNTSLFPSQRMVEEMWRIVHPLLDAPPPVERYARGTWGPLAADRLAEPFGGWRNQSAEG